MAPTAQDVASWLGTDSPEVLSQAAAVLPSITAMVNNYTRGRGFTRPMFQPAAEPLPDVAAVIISVTARVLANPEQLQQSETTGPFTRSVAGWQGFTLLERLVLDRYRPKAM